MSSKNPSYLQIKDDVKILVTQRLEFFNQRYGFYWNRVSIKNTKRRWGSCSRKGNLNFCYRIALIKPELMDYVVVHELCHLGEFNHSKNFWSLVERGITNYKELRRELLDIRFR